MNPKNVEPEEANSLHPPDPRIQELVEKYCRAVQTTDCDTIIAMTWWMQERLFRERKATSPIDDASVRRSLCEGLQRTDPEGKILQIIGLDDPYIFLPGAQFEVVGADGGSDDLAKPVNERVWLRLHYPNIGSAPKDDSGIYIRNLLVALSVSTDGYILRAGVRGNAEVDLTAVGY